ncbi:MAG: pyruvate kinase, partial [bacterium]
VYSSHKGVNFPNARLKVPSMTAKDRRDLRFILTQPVDYIALSFVRAAHDLKALNSAIFRAGKRIKTIAKIEKPEAAADIERILDACDGIMVARGDLGVETSPYEVPQLQKDLVLKGNRKGKLVIVATQMLESMIEHPLPTRAESTDVANAILDGTDACMLSGETAVGAYPVESVRTMTRIAQAIETSSYFGSGEPVNLNLKDHSGPHSVCEAASWASRDLGGVPVLVFTMSGDTALYMAKIRNQSPIIAISPHPEVVSMLSLAWNVRAFYVPFERDVVSLQRRAESFLVRKGILRKKQQIVVLCGTMPVRGATNFMRVKEVG